MAHITLKGNPIDTVGELPSVGSPAPDFSLTGRDLKDVGLEAFSGKRKLLNIVPSLDTGVCAASARRFNAAANEAKNGVMLIISRDLPFAMGRFCEAEGLANVVTLSELRALRFGDDYGVRIANGPLAGLLSRAVVVLDEANQVVYTEQVPEIGREPDYDRALVALRG